MSCGQNVRLMYRLCFCKTLGHILCIWLQADNGVTSLNVLMKLSGLFFLQVPANLFLRVERCWATPTKDPYSNIQYNFIRDRSVT